jgi:DNA-binding HxlR family transcriptional regulator
MRTAIAPLPTHRAHRAPVPQTRAPAPRDRPSETYRLQTASRVQYAARMASKASGPRRSGCPVSVSLDIFGDRWSLIIVRDLMVRGYRTFSEMEHDGDGIATNILSDRLRKLEASGILGTEPAPDGRSNIYRLTEKGIALGPVMLELLIWGARHESTGAPCEVIDHLAANRQAVLVETYRRWSERDPTPLIPPFTALPQRHARKRARPRRKIAKRRAAR